MSLSPSLPMDRPSHPLNGPGPADPGSARDRVAYLMSRFPKITETFILSEIVRLPAEGIDVEVYPLMRERSTVVHEEADAVARFARFCSLGSPSVLLAQAYWLCRRPGAYLAAWRDAILGNRGSLSFVLRSLFVVPKAAWMARDMMRRQVRHVHAHWVTHPGLAAFCIHRLTGIPYSLTIHAHDLFMTRSMLERKVREAAFVVTISDYNKELLRSICGDDVLPKIRIVRYGVDLTRFVPPPDRRAALPPVIACVASLNPYKGHSFLVEACARLRARALGLRCICIGEGPCRAELTRQIASRGLDQDVRLAGAKTHAEVIELLKSASLFVMPSIVEPSGRTEGIPNALLEAMAMELPVVATRVSGIPELVENERTGLLVEPEDAAGLAEAMERLLTDPALAARLAEAGAARVREQYDMRKNLPVLAGLFRSTCRSGERAAGVAST